jgi:hypothetical protein
MRKLKFYEWLLKEDKTAYKQKLTALSNALGLKFNLDDEDSIKAAGNTDLNTLDQEIVLNIKNNTMYIDIKNDAKKDAIDKLLAKATSDTVKVGELANIMLDK